MAAEQKPGRRRAAPPPRRLRWRGKSSPSASSAPEPAPEPNESVADSPTGSRAPSTPPRDSDPTASLPAVDGPAPREAKPSAPEATQEIPSVGSPLRTVYRSTEGQRAGRRIAGKDSGHAAGEAPDQDAGKQSRRDKGRRSADPVENPSRRAVRRPSRRAEPEPAAAPVPESEPQAPEPTTASGERTAPTAASTTGATSALAETAAAHQGEPTRRSRHDDRKRQEARERLEARNRRSAEPPPRRRLDGPAAADPSSDASAEDFRRGPQETSKWRARGRALMGFLTRTLWLSVLAAALVAVVLPWAVPDAPEKIRLAGAVVITSLFTHGLAVRSGGRPLMSLGLALVLSSVAAVSQVDVLLAGATVATVVVTAILAVLATTPSAAFQGVIREVSIAAVIGVIGAFGARAWGAEVSLERTAYLAIGLSLVGALALVYRLGAGLHGLGRRGFVMIISGVGLLTVTLAYTEALATWGSPAMIERIDQAFDAVRDTLGAVPRPIEVLLGFPALAWGISTRARRRQGWWVCAFGAPGLSVLAVSLLDPGRTLVEEGLTVLYSLVLGLLVGYLVIRADLYLTGARGRRARQLEELAAHRPEPGRFQPLL